MREQRSEPQTAASHCRGRSGGVGKILDRITSLLLLLAIAGVAVAAVSVTSGRWQARPVLTGSMRPSLAEGSVAVAQRVPTDKVGVGDVIVFHNPDDPRMLTVHRIASISRETGRPVIQTKGDANPTVDPWTISLRGQYAYLVRMEIPYFGYVVATVRHPISRTTLMIVGSLVVLVALIRLLLPERRSAPIHP